MRPHDGPGFSPRGACADVAANADRFSTLKTHPRCMERRKCAGSHPLRRTNRGQRHRPNAYRQSPSAAPRRARTHTHSRRNTLDRVHSLSRSSAAIPAHSERQLLFPSRREHPNDTPQRALATAREEQPISDQLQQWVVSVPGGSTAARSGAHPARPPRSPTNPIPRALALPQHSLSRQVLHVLRHRGLQG